MSSGENKMKYKVWAISLCYNDFDIIQKSLQQFYATYGDRVEVEHVLVDQHWPIDKQMHQLKLKEFCKHNNFIYMNPGRNLGLAKGFNYALDNSNIPDNAMVVGYDPDSYPTKENWLDAMCDVFVADQSIGWISLWHQHSSRQLVSEGAGKQQEMIGGWRVNVVNQAVMNSVCGFRMSWLRKTGGLQEPNEYYGGLEVCMFPKLAQHKMRWVFMSDYFERPELNSPRAYQVYKWKYAHEHSVKTDFETWVNAGYPGWDGK